MPNDVALSARGLVKRFGDLVAVDGVDLAARRGTCLGLLGPNGAGKTTTIEMLEGLLRPDAGAIEVLGLGWERDGAAIRERIGVQLQETRLEDKLKVREVVRLFQSFYREPRPADEVLDLVGLQEKREARVDALSGGQRQRLALACALVHRPELLFLDEPSTGLDPQARRRVWEIVGGFTAAGGTVLLTTHYMEEAERLADDLVIVDRGRVVARGSPRALIARLNAESIVELVARPETGDAERLADLVAGLDGVVAARRDGSTLSLTVTDTQRGMGALLALLAREGIELEELSTHRPTLEDVFVHLTGKHLRDE
jgi:ABC-2 type transport system ATP-binding protein